MDTAVPAWATFAPHLHRLLAARSPRLTPLRTARRRAPQWRACDAPPTAPPTAATSAAAAAADSEVVDAAPYATPSTPRQLPLGNGPELESPEAGHVPGPPPLPVVGNALDVVGCPLSELMLRYARTYGPLMRFAIVNDVLYLASDPVLVHHLTVANAKNYLDRWTPPGFQLLLYDGTLRGLVFSQGKYWMQHRQVVGSVFRASDFLHHYVKVTVEKTEMLLEQLWKRRVPTIANVHQEMRMLTLDIIGAAAFGTEFGAMSSPNGAHEIETCLSNILHGVLDVIKSPVPLWRVMRTPGRAAIDDDLRRLQRVELSLIHERRARLQAAAAAGLDDPQDRKDLLGRLLRARDSDSGAHFRDEDLMWDVHDVIFAGHETTASALAAALFLVAGSPRVLRKLQRELDHVLPDGRVPRLADVGKLQYLDMVLNEALRLYPPTALVGRCAKEADVVGGFHIPAGANVLMSPYVMGRLERLWDKPEEFRPERFAPEEVAKRHRMAHTPFGAGPRVCLGAHLATMEAKVVLAMVFQRYAFERTQEVLEVDYDSTVSFKSGMELKIFERA